MNTFKDYLLEKNITTSQYLNRYINPIREYEACLVTQNKDIEKASYQDMMNYLAQLENDKSLDYRNRFLLALSHYYDYLQLPNLAQNTRLKGIQKSKPSHLFSPKQLDAIYTNYEVQVKARNSLLYHSDKLILSLIIYQGVSRKSIQRLETTDIDLKKGTVYLKSGRQNNSRKIPLEAHQILVLYRFMQEIRPTLLQADNRSNLLFAPQAESYQNSTHQLLELGRSVRVQMKEKLGLEVIKLDQLRQSRISVWVKEKGLREAQYLAGFKKVSSAERYQDALLEDLKKQVNLHHPLSK